MTDQNKQNGPRIQQKMDCACAIYIFQVSCISGNALSVKLCNCTKFHYSYKKVGHGVVSYTIFMFIPKTGCAKMHCACAVHICQGGSISKMLSRSWSTTVPKTMLVSGIAQSIENMALSRSATRPLYPVFYHYIKRTYCYIMDKLQCSA